MSVFADKELWFSYVLYFVLESTKSFSQVSLKRLAVLSYSIHF